LQGNFDLQSGLQTEGKISEIFVPPQFTHSNRNW